MSQIIKTFLGIFLILLMSVCCFGILGTFLNVVRAQNVHAQIVDELENSHYYSAVMKSCFDMAAEENYNLSLAIYEPGKEMYMVERTGDVPADTSGFQKVCVRLEFEMGVPLFGVSEKQVLTAYAR